MKYQITHRTAYHYADVVSSSYGQIHLLPRNDAGQVCHDSSVIVDPQPSDQREHADYFGNRFVYFEILAPHRDLSITAISSVEIETGPGHPDLAGTQAWEIARPAGSTDPVDLDAVQFQLDSPLVVATDRLGEYGARSFFPGRPLLEGLVDLTQRIHDDLEYKSGATSVSTTADEALEGRAGVCQDFAHVAIGCLRSLGLAARYVSGYLETDPPPGKPRLVGADVSHAWGSLYVPGSGWVDFDPTNRQLVTERYITTAWGRDYRDVPPVQGVIYTDGTKHELEVSVDVIRVEGI